MENLVDASQTFNKEALLRIHNAVRQEIVEDVPVTGTIESRVSYRDPIGRRGVASSVPLERLNPISLTQLQVGTVHYDRVLYGTLCADAFQMTGIMTLLEDDNGRAVRVAIYNAADLHTDISGLYPKGAKAAIRDPYFKLAWDGGVAIRVDNPANVHILDDH